MIRSGPITDGVLRSAPPRASPKGRAPEPVADVEGRPADGASESDLLKFGNMRFHLRFDATNATTLGFCRRLGHLDCFSAQAPYGDPPSMFPAAGHGSFGAFCGQDYGFSAR